MVSARNRAFAKPGFEAIVALDFYDGPESGLAIYASGAGLRFDSLADSRSRCFRSYELIPVEGNWKGSVAKLRSVDPRGQASRVIIPREDSDELTKLELDIYAAHANGLYLAIGSPWVEKLNIMPISEAALVEIRRLKRSPEGFRAAHSLVKEFNRTMAV